MKSLITIIGILALLLGAEAQAEDKLLTDLMLETVTAGQTDAVVQLQANQVQQTSYVSTNNLYEDKFQNQIENGSPNALNVVNVPNISVNNSIDNSQNVNSRNDFLLMDEFAQENARAVNLINSVQSTVSNGVNAHFTASGGSLNNLYQTNIITNINRP